MPLFPASAYTDAEFRKIAMEARKAALQGLAPIVMIPTEAQRAVGFGQYPWKSSIVTTVFWVGEVPTANNPVHNFSSSWDREWYRSFGGFDNPSATARRSLPEGGTIPANFIPLQNPFYVALPYNDVSMGRTKPEARLIPWFKRAFTEEGDSVCRDRWVAIRKGNRVCYAQWADCGPFRTDHFNYVFGNERPSPNLNRGAGLDVSPAVRDYLGLRGLDYTDWKFVEFDDVPFGPWARFGSNNPFTQRNRTPQNARQSAVPASASRQPQPPTDGPRILTQ
jgi:hypothetical protein